MKSPEKSTTFPRSERHPWSARTDFGPPSSDFARLKERFLQHPIPLDLTCTNPGQVDLPLPDFTRLLSETSTNTYRPSSRGSESARAAIAQSLAPRAKISTSDILLTASTSEAYSFLLHALCDPGDSIVVPRPSYPLFFQLSQIAGVNIVPFDITYDGAWHLALESLPSKREIQEKRIRAIMVVSPNNPTGNSLSEHELRKLRHLELPLIIDEVFRPYVHDESRNHKERELDADPLVAHDSSDLTIFVDGLSKRSCAPGLKLGWIIALGRDAPSLFSRLEWLSDSFLSVNAQVQEALPAILKEEPATQDIVRSRLSKNVALVHEKFSGTSATPLQSAGGWSIIVQFPNTQSEEKWWGEASDAGVWVQPGQIYSLPQPCAFVLSLLTPPKDFALGLERLALLLNK